MKEYTKEDMIELIEEYYTIDRDTPIHFDYTDGVYTLEFCFPFEYLTDKFTQYICTAELFESYNEEDETMETILEIDAMAEWFGHSDTWTDRIVI